MISKKLLNLIVDYEEIYDTIRLELFSDGSGNIYNFYPGQNKIKSFDSIKDLKKFIKRKINKHKKKLLTSQYLSTGKVC